MRGDVPEWAAMTGNAGPVLAPDVVWSRVAAAELVMIAPSRGRPAAMAELIAQWAAVTAGSLLLLAVDDDDPELPGYLALRHPWTLVGPRLRLGGTLNELAPRVAESGPVAVGFLGDDHRPRTVGWDVVITTDIIRTLGWMVPPGMIHLYLDDFWRRLGSDLDRLVYLPDVVIEHMHPHAGKGVWDDRYQEVNSAEMYAHDGTILQRYLGTDWPTDRARLRTRLRPVAAR
jgi:hypothetical protein